MWPKITENPRNNQTKLIFDPQELYSFLVTPGIKVTNLLFAGDDVVWISWRHAEGTHVPNLRHTNEVTGSYVMSGVRLHLYGYLDKLEDRAIYCDTENVVYIQPWDGPALVEIGDCLGGPKNYAYITFNSVTCAEKTVRKVKGITLKYNTSQLVNFEKIKDMILKEN